MNEGIQAQVIEMSFTKQLGRNTPIFPTLLGQKIKSSKIFTQKSNKDKMWK
jgi:hypothetical protein